MNKKITLYELLGLVKDGQAPKKIKVSTETFIFSNGRYYEENHIGDDNGRMGDYFALDGMLNDEVEILEEEKKIGNVNLRYVVCDSDFTDKHIVQELNNFFEENDTIINQLIDEINKIKENRE